MTLRRNGNITSQASPPHTTTSSRKRNCGSIPPTCHGSLTVKRLMNRRDHVHRTGNTTLYKSLRNKMIKRNCQQKANFYPSKLQQMRQTNQSKWYGKIKELCGLNKAPRTSPCINHLSSHDAANEVNKHSLPTPPQPRHHPVPCLSPHSNYRSGS